MISALVYHLKQALANSSDKIERRRFLTPFYNPIAREQLSQRQENATESFLDFERIVNMSGEQQATTAGILAQKADRIISRFNVKERSCIAALFLAAAGSLGFLAVLNAVHAAEPIYLRVNQVGYLPFEEKLGFALTNADLSGQTFSVVSDSGANVLTAPVGNDRGAYGNFTHLYELNFSAVRTTGSFRLRVASDDSPIFAIGANTYGDMFGTTLQFYRVQRCGNTNPLLHGVCHLVDGIVANGSQRGRHIDVTGGWHDAGDYLKFIITDAFATTLMLHAYERHPEVFADIDHNNIPDVLDEARIGLDWLLKMWDPENRELYYQVGDYRDHGEWRLPDGDDASRPSTRTVWACEAGKGANIAGKMAAAFALAAWLWNDRTRSFYDPALAASFLSAAAQIYSFGKARPATQPSTTDPGTPPSAFYDEQTWQDEMALGAAELYRATGDPAYLADARMYAAAAGSSASLYWGNVSMLAQYEIARLDASYRPSAAQFMEEDLNTYQTNFFNSSFRTALSGFYWGSAADMAGAALTALWYEDLTGNSSYRTIALAQRDYLLGANPWGVCFVNSVGTTWPHNPHHQVANLTQSELVGFWDEGPANLETFIGEGITLSAADAYAAFQTPDAVFHDDVRDYTTNEPIVSMNAEGLTLISWFGPDAAARVTSVPFVVMERGGLSAATDGRASSLILGYARIQPDSGSETPSGIAIFASRNNDILVSETGVPATPALTSGLIYAEVAGTLDTGLAIANPNGSDATINFSLTDANGSPAGSGKITIAANKQTAQFLDQAPLKVYPGTAFQGTLSFTSSVPVGVIALRTLVNQRGDFLMSSLPVIDTTTPPISGPVMVPQFTDGGGWATQIILVNPTEKLLKGTLQFFDPNGGVTNVTIGGSTSNTFAYAVSGRSAQKLVTAGAKPALASGSVRIVPDAGGVTPTPLVVFSNKPLGITVSEAGVPVNTGTALRMYVESSGIPGKAGNIQSGIAVANPYSSSVSVMFDVTDLNFFRCWPMEEVLAQSSFCSAGKGADHHRDPFDFSIKTVRH